MAKRFGYRGAFIWNKLPKDLRECKSMNLLELELELRYYNPHLELSFSKIN